MATVTTIDLPPIFAACCDRRGAISRHGLSTPFAQDGYVYATDGRIAVRVPADAALADAYVVAPGRKVPRPMAVPVFADADFRAEPAAIPDLSGLAKCATCTGSGAIPGLLDSLDVPRRPLVVECECSDCGRVDARDVTARVFGGECPDCDGSGLADNSAPVVLAPGHEIAAGYARLLVRHGVAVVDLPRKPGKAVRFVLGDCEGRLMPLRPDDDAKGD